MKLTTVAFVAVLVVGWPGARAFSGESRTAAGSNAVSSLRRSDPPSIFGPRRSLHHSNRALIRRRHRFVPHRHFIFLLPPSSIVATSPYFCFDHARGFVSRAGFLDHVTGTHKIPLENSLAFCSEGGSSCVFPGP